MKLVLVKFKNLSIILLALFVAACSPNENNNEDRIELHLKQSNAYQQQGQYRAAIIEARNVIKKAPDSELGFLRLGELLMALGNNKEAAEVLERSSANPNSLLLLLAKSYLNQGKFISAETTLTSLRYSPDENRPLEFLLIDNQIQAKKLGFEKTLDKFTSTSEKFPESTDAKIQLVAALVNLEEIETARTVITKALELNPSSAETLYLAANLAYLEKNLPTAERYLSDALIASPNTDLITPLKSRILRQLTTVLTEQGRSTEALAYSKLLATSDPDANRARSQFTEALKLLQSGNLKDAEILLKELGNNYPGNEISDIYLGLINYQRGDLERADDLLSTNIDPEIAPPRLIQTSALAKLKLEKNDEAFNLLESALQTYPNNEQLLITYGINSLLNEGKTESGVLALEKALSINPQNTDIRITLANYYVKESQKERGEILLTEGMAQQPTNTELAAAYTQLLVSDNKVADAERFVDTRLTLQPKTVEILNLAARLSLFSKDSTKAEELYQRSLALRPQDLEALQNLGAIAINEKNTILALKYYRRLVSAYPKNPIGYKGIITAHEIAGNSKKGSIEINKYTEPYSDSESTAAAVLAEYYLRKADIDQAVAFLNQAKERSQKSPYFATIETNLKFLQAQKAIESQNSDLARKLLLEAISLTQGNQRLYSALISVEINSKKYAEANKLVNEAEILFPNSQMPILAKAHLSILSDDSKQAREILTKEWNRRPTELIAERLIALLGEQPTIKNQILDEWRKLEPQNYKPVLFAAIHAQNNNKPQQAAELYQAAYKLNSKNPIILNNLAWIHFEQGNDQAESLAKKAHELTPDNPAILDTYGWILLHNGKIDLARKYLKRASELAPQNHEILEHYRKSMAL